MLEFDKAVSEAHLKASGWDMGTFGHSNPFECHFVYVHDLDTKDVRLFSIQQSHIDNAPALHGIPMPTLAFMVADLLEKMRKGELNPVNDASFLPALIGYVLGTQAYALWRSQGKIKLHFILNVYRSRQGPEKAMLRPAVANSDDAVLSSKDMMALSKQLIDMDKARHPEWFV